MPWPRALAEGLTLLLLAALAAALAELRWREARTAERLQQVLEEQAGLAAEAVAARLEARALQVDPLALLAELEAVAEVAARAPETARGIAPP